jgi:hypothetical protein
MRPIGNQTGAVMSSNALNVRDDCVGASPALGVISGGQDAGHEMSAVSARLLHYWRVILPLPVTSRRVALDAACGRVRRNSSAMADLLSFALGDSDEEIVYRATLAHVGAYPPRAARWTTTVDAVEWVRRRLAVNCAAVFAALLSLGDEELLAALLPLRSTLSAEEVTAIRRRMGAGCAEPARTFLQSWADLTDPSGDACG